MKYVLLFRLVPGRIQWHDADSNDKLFNKSVGTTDEYGWTTTGLKFESGDKAWTYWVCRIIDVAFDGRDDVTPKMVLRMLSHLYAFHIGMDLVEFEENYPKIAARL